MANQDQLDILEQGVEAWNQWREEHTEVKPDLSDADLHRADLSYTNLSDANLSGANLFSATLVGTNCTKAILTNCSIYGISTWNVDLEGATQDGLIITRGGEPTVKVDNLEVAQFIYLLLNYKKLRDVLNAVTERGVLLLGRFGGGGLEVLHAIAARLREENYLPIIFDFERPQDGVITFFPVKIPAQLGGLTALLPHHTAKRPSLVPLCVK